MSQSRELLEFARAAAASPRLADATTRTAIALGVLAPVLQRIAGWPAVAAMLATLALLVSAVLVLRWRSLPWQGILPVSLLLFVAWCLLSVLWSGYRLESLAGVAYLLGFTILGVAIALTRDTIQVVRAAGDVFRVVLAGSLALEVFAGILIDSPLPYLGIHGDLDDLGPIQGLLITRNQFALLALLALITFSIELATRSVGRAVGVSSIVLGALSAALSRSPIVLATLVVIGLAVLALWLVRRAPASARSFVQLGILAGGLAVAVVAWFLRGAIIDLFSAATELDYRLELWQRLWMLTQRDPLLGTGFVGYWRDDVGVFRFIGPPGEPDPGSALSAYLDLWYQVGAVGLFLFVVLVLLTFIRSWLLAGRRRSVVFAWAPLIVLALAVTGFAESSMLVEYGWLLLVICTVQAAQDLSWRTAWRPTPDAAFKPRSE